MAPHSGQNLGLPSIFVPHSVQNFSFLMGWPHSAQNFAPAAGLTFGWELDLWGKFRRATEAAQAQLLASQDVRDGVVISLVAQVSQAYFTLRSLDLDLEISKHLCLALLHPLDQLILPPA